MPLSPEQQTRYERNWRIPDFGLAGQERLRQARVCIVGLGGLGSPAAFYLTAAGVGTLGLVDSDCVELSNLQRQVLHTADRIGRPKVESAALTLSALNPDVELQLICARITSDNAESVLSAFDAVVEASDNFETKYLLNDTCVELGKPLATAGILSLSGQALFVVPGESACLRCVAPTPPTGVPTTAERGVLGAVPGILGSLEAMEVIRWIGGLWRAQAGGDGLLHTVNGDGMRLHTMRVPRKADCRCASRWVPIVSQAGHARVSGS